MPLKLFSIGTVLATADALRALEYNEVSPQSLLRRHACGDWGDLPRRDKHGNEARALCKEGIVKSRHRLGDGEIVFITTSFGHHATLISQPGDPDTDRWVECWYEAPARDVPACMHHFVVSLAGETSPLHAGPVVHRP